MKEYDYVKLMVEKEKYAVDGVHKGMVGWICDSRIINAQHLVCFDVNDLDEYPIISVKINDLKIVCEAPVLEIGRRVMLTVRGYEQFGIKIEDKGVIVDKGKGKNHWLVKFNEDKFVEIASEALYMYDPKDWRMYD